MAQAARLAEGQRIGAAQGCQLRVGQRLLLLCDCCRSCLWCTPEAWQPSTRGIEAHRSDSTPQPEGPLPCHLPPTAQERWLLWIGLAVFMAVVAYIVQVGAARRWGWTLGIAKCSQVLGGVHCAIGLAHKVAAQRARPGGKGRAVGCSLT